MVIRGTAVFGSSALASFDSYGSCFFICTVELLLPHISVKHSQLTYGQFSILILFLSSLKCQGLVQICGHMLGLKIVKVKQ